MSFSITKHFSLQGKVVTHIFLLLLTVATVMPGQSLGGRRMPFNDGWLFRKGDPAGAGDTLSYDKIKNWVMPTGNEFSVLSKRSARPGGHVGDDVSYTKPKFDDKAWRQLDLPHDWCIEGDFEPDLNGESARLPCVGVGWYRKHFSLDQADAGKQIFIDFDGAMSHSSVWLNGRFVGGWPYGYASFRLELTPYVEFGKENMLAVRLDNPPDSSRWYPGAGIYRNVWLSKTAQVHVGQWETIVTTPTVTNDKAEVNASVNVTNDSANEVSVTVDTSIYKLNNGARAEIPAAEVRSINITIGPHSARVAESGVAINAPYLWSPQTPNLYVAVTRIKQNGELVDTCETKFGVRSIKFEAAAGFVLNGEHLYLKGVCEHDDLGALGLAFNKRALERKFEILKEMGVNAIRTSHNPHAPEFLDLADKMGFLVLDEAFDTWTRPKRANDYSTLFADWHEKDLRAFIRRDRNHPSVILWSTGNEIFEQDPAGHAISSELARIVHEEDPTRPVTAAANLGEAGYNGFEKTVDVFGYNYKPNEYRKFHALNPTIPIFSTESSSTISSRGEYFFPVPRSRTYGLHDVAVGPDELISAWLARIIYDESWTSVYAPVKYRQFYQASDVNPSGTNYVLRRGEYFFPEIEDVANGFTDFQLSSYDLIHQSWATLAETEFEGQDANPFVAGEFVWTGFDYLGETNPFDGIGATRSQYADPAVLAKVKNDIATTGKIKVPQRSSYFGVVDTCGFKKDRFFLYQARWRPDLPMVHILPHWNWPERVGEITPVHVYTSGDEAELFLNGVSLGRKKRAAFQYRLRWDDVVYQPGELKVIAYKNGIQWAEDTVRTTTGPTQIAMAADRGEIDSDGSDLSFITVRIADKNGATVPRSKNRIRFEINGPGEIAGIDNGDATDLDSFRSTDRRVFNGLALIIVRSKTGQPGKITVKASSGDLKGALSITSR